jgi:hypothetical protein
MVMLFSYRPEVQCLYRQPGQHRYQLNETVYVSVKKFLMVTQTDWTRWSVDSTVFKIEKEHIS